MALWKAISESIDFAALVNNVVSYLPTFLAQAVAAACVLAGFWLGFAIARRLLKLYFGGIGMPGPVSVLLVTLLRYAVLAVALVTAASQFDVNVSSLLAGLGVAGLAVSFAAQDTFGNIISGITLVIDKPFVVGDWVEVGGVHAHVTKIRLRTTTLSTFDNQTIVVPNKQIAQERIINYTLMPRIRVRVAVGIAYKEDIRTARQVILATLAGDQDVLAEPGPQVVVTGLGSSSVDLELRFWIEEAVRLWPKQWEYTEKCKYALDEAGIEIPFPHLQMFIERTQGLEQLGEAISRC